MRLPLGADVIRPLRKFELRANFDIDPDALHFLHTVRIELSLLHTPPTVRHAVDVIRSKDVKEHCPIVRLTALQHALLKVLGERRRVEARHV